MKKYVLRVTTSPIHIYNVLCGIKLPRGVVEGPSEVLKRFPLGSEVSFKYRSADICMARSPTDIEQIRPNCIQGLVRALCRAGVVKNDAG